MLQLVLIQFAAWFHLPSLKLPSFSHLFAEESAQDTFEYLLVAGVIVVAIVGAVTFGPTLIGTVQDDVTTAITGLF